MSRARKSRAARRPSPRPARKALTAARAPEAEAGLLDVSRIVTALGGPETSPRDAVRQALDALVAALGRGAPLPSLLAGARIAARGDKARALGLAWAREQLRQSLGEILGRAATAGDVRVDLPPDSLAWLTLAACETLADEPPQAIADRVRLLEEWLLGPRIDG